MRNLEWKKLLNSCRLTVCKYPPVGNSLILIIVQKSRHFTLLIGVSYKRIFTRRERDLGKRAVPLTPQCVGEKGEWRERNSRNNGGKVSLLVFFWLGLCGCGCGIPLPPWKLDWVHSFLIKFDYMSSPPLFWGKSIPTKKAQSSGSSRLQSRLSAFAVVRTFPHLDALYGHISYCAVLTWFCSNKLRSCFRWFIWWEHWDPWYVNWPLWSFS